MTKRNIANEILRGLEDFAAWRAGERKLRTAAVDPVGKRSVEETGSARSACRGKPIKGSAS
jgi:hypothetical protein